MNSDLPAPLDPLFKGLHASSVVIDGEAAVLSLDGPLDGITLTDAQRLLALERYLPWWIRPIVPRAVGDLPKEVLLLLWQRGDGRYGVLLPLAHRGRRAFLTSTDGSLRIEAVGRATEGPDPLLAVAWGDDPFAALDAAWALAATQLKTFRPRHEKPAPTFIDRFGWCTWDAFYSKVDEAGVLSGLETLTAAGATPGFLILDDGWLDTRDSFLWSFAANAKFPDGLAGTIRRVKEQFSVDYFGAWHTLQGYWAGVHPDSPLAERFEVIDAADKGWHGKNWNAHHGERRGLVRPEGAGEFFRAWYGELASAGVDFTKVDNQGSNEQFGGEEAIDAPTAAAYQDALQAAAAEQFDGGIIHCMGQTNAVLCNLHTTSLVRNSDDYFPKRPWSHGFHVYANACSALWTGGVAVPDWDMFHSHHEAGRFHGVARAISGGPVYVSDKPGEHDAELLRMLFTSGSRVLRSETPARITRDRLFTNCVDEPHLLKVFNRNGPVGVLGLFHCHWAGDKTEGATNAAGNLTDSWSPRDVEGVAAEAFACWSPLRQELQRIGSDETVSATLPPFGADVVHLSPIENGLAPLGLLDKLNGSRAIESIDRTDTGLTIHLRDGGRVGFYAEQRPAAVTVNDEPVSFKHDAATGLLVLSAPEGDACVVGVRVLAQ